MTTPPTESPEQLARRQIGVMLGASGWAVQDRAALNLAAGPSVAIREFQTAGGVRYRTLFVGNRLVGVVEAKRAGFILSTVEAQTQDYAARAPKDLQVPIRGKRRQLKDELDHWVAHNGTFETIYCIAWAVE